MELCVEDFTPYTCEHIKQRTDWGVKKGIRVTQFSSTRLTGTTSDTKGRLSSIDLNTMACTCQARQIQSLPCACQMIFIIQTGKINLLSSQFVHSSFRISSWREALRAAIEHPSSFDPCSSSSLPAFQRILPFDWAVPTQPTPESFRFQPSFGLARGRPQALVQNRQLDVRRGRGRKRTLYGFLGVQDPGPPSNATSDPETSSESEEEPEGTPERTSEEGESSNEKDQSQDLYPTLGNCTGCYGNIQFAWLYSLSAPYPSSLWRPNDWRRGIWPKSHMQRVFKGFPGRGPRTPVNSRSSLGSSSPRPAFCQGKER